jgi:PEP-CTERM motif
MIRHMIALGVLASALTFAPSATADSVTWTLTNLTFADGATATGSFVYDASTNTVTSIDITTSTGTTLEGAIYTALDPGYGPYSFDMAFVTTAGLSDYTGTPALEFQSLGDVPLTNAGGVVPVDVNEFICSDAVCDTAAELRGTLEGGTLVGVVNTPEPSSLALLSLGLLGLFGVCARSMFQRSITLTQV